MYLVVAPHMDDEVLGCGGMIATREDDCLVVYVSNRYYDHKYDDKLNNIQLECAKQVAAKLGFRYDYLGFPDEDIDKIPVIDIVKELEKVIINNPITEVFVPFYNDTNQTHRKVFEACRIAFRPFYFTNIKAMYMYEVLSASETYALSTFSPNFFVDISNSIHIKVSCMGLYTTEVRDNAHPRSFDNIYSLARFRGSSVGYNFAEAFMQLWRKM